MTEVMREKNYELTPEERADKYITEAEKAKARIFQTPGKEISPLSSFDMLKLQLHTAIIDEDYETVAGHLDENIQQKIVNGEYVDFARLIPKDRINSMQDENRLYPHQKDGQTYFAPNSSGVIISNFAKWERAFRVYSNIYMKAHPHHAWELNEYNHTIHHITQTYIWDNCYAYDVDFRLFMSKHPERSWAIVLQKAWVYETE